MVSWYNSIEIRVKVLFKRLIWNSSNQCRRWLKVIVHTSYHNMLSFLFYLSVLFDCSFQHINCQHAYYYYSCEDLFWVYISQSVMCRLWPCIPRRIEYRALFMTGSKKIKRKMKELSVGLLLAQNRNQILFHPRSLREHDIVIFMTSLSVSLQ